MLAWARTSAGFSEEELAKKLGLEQARILAWEAGADRPTVKQLQRLASICKRPVAVLYLPEPPRDFMPLRDFRKLPGAGARQVSPELLYQIRRAQERRLAALDLYQEAGAEPPHFTPRATLEEDPEMVGQRLREFLGVTLEARAAWTGLYDAYNNWRAAAERCGVLVFQASDVSLDQMRGFSIAEEPAPAVIVSTKDTPNGRIFTLFHELTHLALRQNGICDLDEEDRPPEDRVIEVFCNAVAGAALVPRDDLLIQQVVATKGARAQWSDEELFQLGRRYRVSREVVLRRLLQFERTTLAFYRKKRQQFLDEYAAIEKTEGFAPPYTKALAAVGKTFARLVLQNYYQDRISLNAVSDYLGIRVKHLAKLEASIW